MRFPASNFSFASFRLNMSIGHPSLAKLIEGKAEIVEGFLAEQLLRLALLLFAR